MAVMNHILKLSLGPIFKEKWIVSCLAQCGIQSYLLMEQVKGELKPHSPHVRPLQRARHVHVHVEEPLHGASHLAGLFDLQLG